MIKYGTVELLDEQGSLVIEITKHQETRHFAGTDKNDVVQLGRGNTVISCRLIARNDTERILIEQILQDDAESTLTIGTFFYKKVITGAGAKPTPVIKYRCWLIDATFIALDPIPYDITTGGALY